MRFLHCSDVHITQDYAATPLSRLGWRRSLAMLELTIGGRAKSFEHAEGTLREIVFEMQRHSADHLLLSGDLTGYATEIEFQRVRSALGPFGSNRESCSVIPGNHDCFTPNAVKTGRFEHHFSHLLESDLPEYRREGPYPFVHLKGDDAAIVGLLSARVVPVPGLAYGRIGAAQLAGLSELLADPRIGHRAVLVMVHHAPFDQRGRPDSRAHGLRDADELLALLPGPRFAVLHGHIHQRYHHAATATRPHVFCAGASTQLGREGYWIIDVNHGRITDAQMHVPQSLLAR